MFFVLSKGREDLIFGCFVILALFYWRVFLYGIKQRRAYNSWNYPLWKIDMFPAEYKCVYICMYMWFHACELNSASCWLYIWWRRQTDLSWKGLFHHPSLLPAIIHSALVYIFGQHYKSIITICMLDPL